MPAVDEQTRRMAMLLGATEAEVEDAQDEEDEVILAKSFYEPDGRMSTYVGVQSDQDRELQTQK